MEWQPIETAPKDGTRVLLARRDWLESMALGFWSDDLGEWKSVIGASFLGATHWAPLPEPPK